MCEEDFDRALADFNEAIRLDPKETLAFTGRAIAWYNKEEYDKAIADNTEAIRINPEICRCVRQPSL